ncbi:MAG: response regulator [Bryobacteraceae bacterium]|nr:response regulator [Bryobacteraceae bacterium]
MAEPVSNASRELDAAADPVTTSARRRRRDLCLCLVFALVGFLACSYFEAFEHFAQLAREHEEWQLDEVIVAGFIASIAAAVYAARRSQDARRELAVRLLTEQQLIQARLDAERASRVKGEFVANMSHEIRTPLNGVLGLAEVVLSTPLQPNQREMIEMLRDAAESLLAVINDVLDFARMESGKLRFTVVDFDIRDMVGSTLKTMAVQAHNKGLELAWHIDAGVPQVIQGDPSRLRQVIVNLIGNAVKFTNRGEVVLHVSTEAVAGDRCSLQFTVRDTGPGIPAEKQAIIFQAFEQVDNSVTRECGGAGLGLAICSQLVALMGGRISVESELGRGSVFQFTAEFRMGPSVPDHSDALQLVSGRAVLIVDDNATNRYILERTVANWNMRAAVADSGAAALHAVTEAHESGGGFDLVLLDCRMPGMDGFEVAERMRSATVAYRPVIMMLTSDERPGSGARSRELGVSTWLTKPLTQKELLKAICEALRPGCTDQRATAHRQHHTKRAKRSLRVLVAEDNKVNQVVTANMLTQVGHVPVVVENGAEAVTILQREAFDVVLMDMQMPVMGGSEATARIRENERSTGGHIPIIALTAGALKGDNEKCLAAGMDGYLAKPVRRDLLLKELELRCGNPVQAAV